MYYIAISLAFLLLLSFSMILFSYLGKMLARWQHTHYPKNKLHNNKIIEGAVFALMGLLIAFTFSGARERFDVRRALVIEEANAIETTYLRLDLLSLSTRNDAKDTLKTYLNTRINIYKKMPHLSDASTELRQSEILQMQIWNTAANECNQEKIAAVCIVLLPAINNMIDISNARFESTQIHPPAVILITLIGLALFSAGLSGYSTRSLSIFHTLYIPAYAIIISFTIFIIVNLEYPDLGLIPVDYFNNVLIHVGEKITH